MTIPLREPGSLDKDKQQAIYTRFWFELTIGARAVWSDPLLGERDKLEGLKALNEIQHRLWHAYTGSAGYTPELLAARIDEHVRQAEHVRGHVGGCYRTAVSYVLGQSQL
jgi:hypothetical protein